MKKSFFFLLTVMLSAFAMAQDNQVDAAGKKHGAWKGYFEASKRVKYEGTFNHGKETGIFTFYDDTKAHTVVATRDFSKGDGSAYTIFFDPKKNKVSEGNVVNKQYEGEWKYYHQASPAVMSIENYKAGKLNGSRKVYYKSGKIAEEENYVNGIREGAYKKYTETGILLEEVVYKNGQPDGIAIYRDSDGNIASKGPYVNGLKKGIWEFYEGGKFKKKEKYPLRRKFAKTTIVKEEN
jgi:antitoxin component YwqK of YwqJK toxin-antitoxin module